MSGESKSTFKDKMRAFWAAVKRYAKRVWAYLKAAKMEYIVMISLFAFDLISKAIVNATMEVGETVTLIPYFLNIHNTHNPNAAFGAGFLKDWFGVLGARIFFCVFAVAASVVFILVLIKHKGGSKLFRVSLAMLVAGAMGNCIDRWALGYVRDFVEFVYFGLTIAGRKSFYIFNIADAELVVGVVLVLIYFIFVYRDKSNEKKHAAVETEQSTAAAQAQSGENNAEIKENVETAESDNNGENAEIVANAQIGESDGAPNADGDNDDTVQAPLTPETSAPDVSGGGAPDDVGEKT